MKRYGLMGAIALIVLTNAVVLAGVVYNRSGEPDAVVQLTERELHWKKHYGMTDKENTGLYLNLKWNMGGFPYRYPPWKFQQEHSWLNREKLEELGFDTSFSINAKNADRYYSRQLPRQAYVVLEFNGDAYQKWLAGAQKRVKEIKQDLSEEKKPKKRKSLGNNIKRIRQDMVTQSHLFTIDGGLDPQQLRKQYSDQSKYIITPAVFDISMYYSGVKKEGPFLSGRIKNLSIPEIHVNSDYQSFFTTDIKTHTLQYHPLEKPLSDLDPRYEVTLNYGQRYEPWIAGTQKIK
jgi:hypothetical protein